MQKCAYCGIDTALWVNGVPMCLVCSDARGPDKAKANDLVLTIWPTLRLCFERPTTVRTPPNQPTTGFV
jgi:hypothetical protein